MTDKKKQSKARKMLNKFWRFWRGVRDDAWDEIEPAADDVVKHIRKELLGLLVAAIAAGVFLNMEAALTWLKETIAELEAD